MFESHTTLPELTTIGIKLPHFNKSSLWSLGLHTFLLISLQITFYSAPEYGIDRGSNTIEIEMASVSPQKSEPLPIVTNNEVATNEIIKSTQSSAETTGQGAETDAKPNYLKNAPPIYPSLARIRNQEGIVLLQVKITVDGLVKSVLLEKSSGFPLLDESALKAVGSWQFLPAQRAGQNIESTVTVPVRFKLTS